MQKIMPISFDFGKPNQVLMENDEEASAPSNLNFNPQITSLKKNPQITFHLTINSLCPK